MVDKKDLYKLVQYHSRIEYLILIGWQIEKV